MKRFLLLLTLASAAFAGTIHIEMFPMLGPESGPNFDSWAQNVLTALQDGNPIPVGYPDDPTDVKIVPMIYARDIVYSPGQESWRGVMGVPGQTGTNLYFPVRIWSDDPSDTTFRMTSVEFRQNSSDPDNWWRWPQSADPWDSLASDTFSPWRIGVDADGNPLPEDADPNTLLSALYWIGVPGGGMYADPPTGGLTYQDMLNQAIRDVEAIGLHTITTEYRVDGVTGGGDIDIVPEPASGLLLLVGVGLVWAGRRRR